MYISTYIYIYIYLHAFRRSYFGSNLHVSPYRCASIQGTMTEDGGLFNKKDRSDEPELPLSKKAKTDLYVSPGNSLSRKMLDPYGMNELDKISLANLWAKASKGDEHVPRYTEYAISDDLNYPGLAVARSMKNLGLAMKHLMDKNEAGQIIDGAIYRLLEVECSALEPHVAVLSGGQMRKDGGGKLNAYKAVPVDPIAAEASAKYIYAWLHEESTLRSILKFLAKGGVFYTAFANEKLTRAYIVGKKVTEEDFMKLCLHRLSNPEPADESLSADRVTDWARVKAR